jgi:hypothetical protein
MSWMRDKRRKLRVYRQTETQTSPSLGSVPPAAASSCDIVSKSEKRHDTHAPQPGREKQEAQRRWWDGATGLRRARERRTLALWLGRRAGTTVVARTAAAARLGREAR